MRLLCNCPESPSLLLQESGAMIWLLVSLTLKPAQLMCCPNTEKMREILAISFVISWFDAWFWTSVFFFNISRTKGLDLGPTTSASWSSGSSAFFSFALPLSQKVVVNLAFSAASIELRCFGRRSYWKVEPWCNVMVWYWCGLNSFLLSSCCVPGTDAGHYGQDKK